MTNTRVRGSQYQSYTSLSHGGSGRPLASRISASRDSVHHFIVSYFFKSRKMLRLEYQQLPLRPNLPPESFKIRSNDFAHKFYQVEKPAINLFLLRVWLEGSVSFSTRWPPLVGSWSIYTRVWVHDCAEDTKNDDNDLGIYSFRGE